MRLLPHCEANGKKNRKEKVDSELSECEGFIREKTAEVEAMEGELAEGVDSERDAVCEEFRDGQELTYEMAHAFIEPMEHTTERMLRWVISKTRTRQGIF